MLHNHELSLSGAQHVVLPTRRRKNHHLSGRPLITQTSEGGSTMTEKNPDKGYVAILGWSLNAIDAIDRFDRRYVIVAPVWAEDYAKANDIPFIPGISIGSTSARTRSRRSSRTRAAMWRFRSTRRQSNGRVRSIPCCSTIRAFWVSRCSSGTNRS